MKKALSPKQALVKAQELCARSEQCSSDVSAKLRGWGISSETAEKIIGLLQRERYIDDTRFAISYVSDKYRFSGWGVHKITAGLLQKKISRPDIQTAVEAIDREEYETKALAVLRSKVRSAGFDTSYENRIKLWRFGVTRGYESALVSSLIKSGKVYGSD